MKRFAPLSVMAPLLVMALLAGCGDKATPAATSAPEATYVGSERCADCHADQHEQWLSSHHAAAMQPATPQTVLAQWAGTHNGVNLTSEGAQYWVSTESESPLPVRYTFGVFPLQQFLVETQDGRLQALDLAWDSRAEADGGQRWIDLFEGNDDPNDVLHWQGRALNWNGMCADCHSTSVRKQASREKLGSFDTTFAEHTVGCEACHGPGSAHLQDPTATWRLDPQAAMESCAPCHSRRAQLAEGFQPGKPWLDYYVPELLQEPLYYADGQIRDEVYVYGSFAASRMHAAGVTCLDCHSPHTGQLKLSGDAVCTQCHNPAGRDGFPTLTAHRYDTPEHHFHEPGATASECISCHMPQTTYMLVDPRRDHGFRPLRPDLTEETPSACLDCHAQQDHQWAARVIADRLGPDRARHVAEPLVTNTTSALTELATDSSLPGMLRATATARLSDRDSWSSRQAVARNLRDSDALVRIGALHSLNRLASEAQQAALDRLFSDPIRAVRITAASQALSLGRQIPQALLEEFEAVQHLHVDTPEAHMNLARLASHGESPAKAQSHLERALSVQPGFTPALINLAQIYQQTGRDAAGGQWLQQAVEAAPDSAPAAYAYGLWLVRQNRFEDGVGALRRAHELAPEQPSFTYAYALALNQAGESGAAIELVEEALEPLQRRSEPQLLLLAATLNRDARRLQQALIWAQALDERGDPRGAALVRQIGQLQQQSQPR